MIKTHWLVSSLLLALTLGACTSSNDTQHQQSEVAIQKISIDKLSIGLNNNKQATPNTPLPIQAKINSKSKIKKVTIRLKKDNTTIWENNYTDIQDQLNTSLPFDQLQSKISPNSKLTIEITANDKNNISISIVEQIDYLDFVIKGVSLNTTYTEEVLNNKIFINSTSSYLNYQNLDYSGELQKVRYYFENPNNKQASFYLDTKVSDFEKDTQKQINIYLEKQLLESNEKIKPGDYHLYIEVTKDDKTYSPVLIQENVSINAPKTQYETTDVIFSATPNYDNSLDRNKFFFDNKRLTFLIKGLKNIYTKNQDIEIIAVRLIENNATSKPHSILVNFIYGYMDASMVLPENQFHGRSNKDIPAYNAYIDIIYSNGYSEAIYVGEITKYN